MDDKQQKLASIDKINGALKAFRGALYVEPSKEGVKYGEYNDLDRHQIDQATIAFVLAANLSGGSMGDMDMYKLARAYLWNSDARAEINDVVNRYGF